MRGKVVLAVLEGLIGNVCIFLGGMGAQQAKTEGRGFDTMPFVLACVGGCLIGLVIVDAAAGYAWRDLWYKECRK